MKKKFVCLFSLFSVFFCSCHSSSYVENYKGSPYLSANEGLPQVIPGKVQLEFFDAGGEGVAYHDTDTSNSGSGGLNQGTGYLDTFRLNEAVDISYTKFHDGIDNSPFNFVEPKESQLYVGWTEPGEWVNYTVEVTRRGKYRVGLMYTCNGDGQISLSVNDKDVTGLLAVESTHVAADTIEWRQWHHWNYMENIAEFSLEEGVQVLTLHTVKNGQMNYDFLSFEFLSE